MAVFAFGKDLWDPSHRFQTSWCLPPYVLAAVRTLFAVYIFVVNVVVVGLNCSSSAAPLGGCQAARDEFSYFTVITYWALGFYFAVAAAHTFSYAASPAARPWLDRWPRPLQALHSLFFSTVIVFPLIVTIIYWGRLYSGTWFTNRFDAWRNLSEHALNSVLAVFEIVFTRTAPPPWLHMLWLIVLLALYLALAYITRATKNFYVYDFLDPGAQTKPALVAAYVFGIAVGCLLVFAIVRAIVFARQWVTETKLGYDGEFAHGHRQQHNHGDQQATQDVEMGGDLSTKVSST